MNLKFDAEGLKELLIDFYTLTKLRLAIYDDEFNKIIAYPEESCGFCEILKSNPASSQHCKKCDKTAFQICKNTNSLYIYNCHAGLSEAAAPIKMNDIIIGYIMFGQTMAPSAKKSRRNEVIEYCTQFCDDRNLLEKQYDAIVCKTEKQIKATAKIMECCACYLWMNQLINIDTGNLSYQISSYIGDNLKNNLSVSEICRVFGISRSKLFAISKEYFGISISRYIKRRRINAAAKYLVENECTVSEAAENSGFSDYNYFSKIFKAEMGCSPIVYRNSNASKKSKKTK